LAAKKLCLYEPPFDEGRNKPAIVAEIAAIGINKPRERAKTKTVQATVATAYDILGQASRQKRRIL